MCVEFRQFVGEKIRQILKTQTKFLCLVCHYSEVKEVSPKASEQLTVNLRLTSYCHLSDNLSCSSKVLLSSLYLHLHHRD